MNSRDFFPTRTSLQRQVTQRLKLIISSAFILSPSSFILSWWPGRVLAARERSRRTSG